MEHGHPFARLAADVAAARARGRPTRLVLRHTERFGLVHLYFHYGTLVHVEGHLSPPLNSLRDLATWQQGVIRRDDDPGVFAEENDPQLDAALVEVIRQLEARGVVQPAPPARIWPPHPGAAPQPAPMFGGSGSLPRATSSGNSIGSGDLPPLSTVDEIERRIPPAPHAPPTLPDQFSPAPAPAAPMPPLAPTPPPAVDTPTEDRLTQAQWQLLALVIHQVVEKAGELVGPRMAEGLLAQALQHATRTHALLAAVEVDALGWLKARDGDTMTRFPTFDVADAVATVLTSFEVRCASLIGADHAQRIVAAAAAPFKAALLQVGLDVAG